MTKIGGALVRWIEITGVDYRSVGERDSLVGGDFSRRRKEVR